MGNLFSEPEFNHCDGKIHNQLYDEIDRLRRDNELKERIIEEQLGMIQILKKREHSDQCFRDGIIQDAGADLRADLMIARQTLDYEYLVFSGGGIKGISYCGALQVLEKMGILYDDNGNFKIKGLAGTSAGAITVALLGVGFTPLEITDILNEMDISKIMDDKIGYIRDAINFIDDYGVCPGKYIYDFMGKKIEEKLGDPDYTIDQLYKEKGVKTVFVTTDMNNLRSIYIFPENPDERYQNIPIRKAVRMSMSIPFIFEPVLLNGDYCVDGGVLDNYAIHAFDGEFPGEPDARLNLLPPNPKVLGLKIVADDNILNYSIKPRQDIESIVQYSLSYIDVFLTENERRVMTPSNWLRTIHIITQDYPLTDFNLDDKKKERLIEAGVKYTEAFFEDE